jgi:probable HAF family extracellular repeat protein
MITGIALWSSAARAQSNDLVDLGVTSGHALNNSGQAALATGIYSNGTVTPLPALPGSATPAVPLAINDAGQVAGEALTSSGIYHAILYSNGTLTDLSALNGASTTGAQANGINASGVVVGWSTCTNCDLFNVAMTSGFIYQNGTFTDLTDLPSGLASGVTYDEPFGINDSGQVTGTAEGAVAITAAYTSDAYIYTNGSWTDFGPGEGAAINATGEVTGALTTKAGANAFLYGNGVTTNIGTLPGGSNASGTAINAAGQVVGYSNITGSQSNHAFFYNGVLTDLNALINPNDPLQPFVTLTYPTGINDSRLILVNGTDSRTNLQHAYLLQAPSISFAPGMLSFTGVVVGSVSPTQAVTVANAGTTAIPFGPVSASSHFSANNECATTIPGSGQCTVLVSFFPTQAGAQPGTLTMASAGVSYVMVLSGVPSIKATLTPSATKLTVGASLTLTWTSSAGSTCTAASSDQNPGWNGSIAASGSKNITESSAGSIAYGIHCTAPSASEADASATVVWSSPAISDSSSTKSGGGGGLDVWELLALVGTLRWKLARAGELSGNGARSKNPRASSQPH